MDLNEESSKEMKINSTMFNNIIISSFFERFNILISFITHELNIASYIIILT